jgi:endonuclease YncB( thermonuclease family)
MFRILGWLGLLLAMMVAGWLIDEWIDPPKLIKASGHAIVVADGDSFAIGVQKLRLNGIDAPEYHQSCKDADGTEWQCGRASRAALEVLLREPGLSCSVTVHDQYARSIATCATSRVPDISAAQVAAGMAVSNEYYSVHNYGDEEDSARDAKLGIWRGTFMLPSDWRAAQPALRTKTVPAE